MAKPKVDDIDPKDLAASYGWALAVLNSHPSLKRLFDRAVAHTWSPQRFIAELRSTPWFKQNSEAMRAATILKTSDPKTWEAKYAQTRAQIKDMATQMGSRFTSQTLHKLTANVMTFGWNDNQIRDVLAQSVKMSGEGNFSGQAAVDIDTLRETALNNGVRLSDSTVRSWAQRMAAGEPPQGFQTYIRDMAASAFPVWAEQLKAGQDIKTLANPYVEQMAQTLELNPNDIDLFDPTIRKTLQATDPDGKPMTKPLHEFERELKQDQRWMKTQNAQDDLMTAGQQVLRDFGFAS